MNKQTKEIVNSIRVYFQDSIRYLTGWHSTCVVAVFETYAIAYIIINGNHKYKTQIDISSTDNFLKCIEEKLFKIIDTHKDVIFEIPAVTIE